MSKNLKPKDVAIKYDVHVETVRRMIRQKKLSAIKFGSQWRVPESSIPPFLIKCRETI